MLPQYTLMHPRDLPMEGSLVLELKLEYQHKSFMPEDPWAFSTLPAINMKFAVTEK